MPPAEQACEHSIDHLAVPHHLHERLYLDAIAAGKDFLAEKPFGIDLEAATRIVAALNERKELFVRCSSEMPFFPGALLALGTISGQLLVSLLLDVVVPAAGHPLSRTTVAGTALTLVALAIATLPQRTASPTSPARD